MSNPSALDGFQNKLEEAERISRWLYADRNKFKMPVSEEDRRRKVMSASSYQLTMEHHQAAIQLTSDGFEGSALALIRPLVEACSWGLWILHVASDAQLDFMVQGNLSRTLPKIQKDLMRAGVLSPEYAPDLKELVHLLDGLTHGDMSQIGWRFALGEVQPYYPRLLICRMLDVAHMHAYLAVQGALELAGDHDARARMHNEMPQYFGGLTGSSAA